MSDLQKLSEWHEAEADEAHAMATCKAVTDGTRDEFERIENGHAETAKILRLLDRVRSECEVRLGNPNDRFDKYGLTVIGPPDLLRQFAERLGRG